MTKKSKPRSNSMPTWTQAEARSAARFLEKVARSIKPGTLHPLPKEIYEPLHRIVTYPAIDAVILDTQNRVLMANRNDKYFKGWELVGGYSHWYDGTPQKWLNRLTLRDIGARAKLIGFAGVRMWRPGRYDGRGKWVPGQHAHGNPISLVAIARLTSKPTKHLDHIGYFPLAKLPARIVPNHRNFIRTAARALKSGAIVPAL